MPCIDLAAPRRLRGRYFVLATALSAMLLNACAPTRGERAPADPVPAAGPAAPVADRVADRAADPRGRPMASPVRPARDWGDYHRLAAQHLVRANPQVTYLGPVPTPLRGIPILEVELRGDGSVLQIRVQRQPRPADAKHTTQLAIDAVRRAAPFPPVSHLPRPWVYTEVFLFDDSDRFKPRTLDD